MCSSRRCGRDERAKLTPPPPPAVTRCEPPLPNLAPLSALLRQENRFADFVKGARKGFAALVQAEIETEEAAAA